MATSELDQDRAIGLDEPAPPEEGEETGGTMSLVEYLEELRKRIIMCAITIVLGSVVGFIFWQPIYHFLLTPLPATADALAPKGVTDPKLWSLGWARAFRRCSSCPWLWALGWARR